MSRVAVIALCMLLSAALAVGCGGNGDGADTGEATAPTTTTTEQTAGVSERCEKVPGALKRALADGLTHGRLGKIAAVKSEDDFEGPAGLAQGVYFVSADVRPNPGIATWAVSAEAFETGGGLIFAVDPAARAASEFGADVDVSNFGISDDSDGASESSDCLG